MTDKQCPTGTTDAITIQQRVLPQLFQLFMLSTIILLIGGGALWEIQSVRGLSVSAHAAGDVGVAGPPTISAATVDAIFARLGSPMVGTGKLVERTSRQTNIDDAFALAVWWTETNDGAAGVGLADRNPGSVRGSVGYPSAFDGYTIYPSYSAAIVYWFTMLRNNYVNRGLSTVYVIARPYVGTSSYLLWAGKVIALMYNYRGMAPPPPAVIPKPKPKPTVNPSVVAARNARIQKLTPWLQYLAAHNYAALTLYRGQTQETNHATARAPQPANSTPTLPFTANLAIVLFGLLTAVALTFYAYKLPIEQSHEYRPSTQEASADQPFDNLRLPPAQTLPPRVQQSPGGSIPITNRSPIPTMPIARRKISPMPAFSLPTRNSSADASPRRVTLLPPKTNTNASTGS